MVFLLNPFLKGVCVCVAVLLAAWCTRTSPWQRSSPSNPVTTTSWTLRGRWLCDRDTGFLYLLMTLNGKTLFLLQLYLWNILAADWKFCVSCLDKISPTCLSWCCHGYRTLLRDVGWLLDFVLFLFYRPIEKKRTWEKYLHLMISWFSDKCNISGFEHFINQSLVDLSTWGDMSWVDPLTLRDRLSQGDLLTQGTRHLCRLEEICRLELTHWLRGSGCLKVTRWLRVPVESGWPVFSSWPVDKGGPVVSWICCGIKAEIKTILVPVVSTCL